MKKILPWGFLLVGSVLGFGLGIVIMHSKGMQQTSIIGKSVNFWKDMIIKKDYSSTQWKLTDEGKTIIHQVRDLHKTPTILSPDKRDDGLCAGYLFELSSLLRGKEAPTAIGMRDPKTHKAANAWELPYSYRYFGGKILAGLSDKIKSKPLDYWKFVNNQDLKTIFLKAFSEESLLGDIGFLYKDTSVLNKLGSYGNYNSHIAKNFGISTFSWTVNSDKGSSSEILRDTLGCDSNVWKKLDLVLPHYQFVVNGKITAFSGSQLRPISGNQFVGSDALRLQTLDTISIQDITLVHFFHGALVDSLLQLVCKGAFYPVNVNSINPKFIEKI